MKNTIVIVDDTRLYQGILKNIVETLGFNTLLCDDGVQAIDCLSKHIDAVAAVFLDIYIPQIDGISVLGHFRSNYPDLPVYIITGSEEASDKRSAVGLGAAGFIAKPFDADTIRATISEKLEKLLPSKLPKQAIS